jgi:hypothetical protein
MSHRYEILVTGLIMAAGILAFCMIRRPGYEPVPYAHLPEIISVPVELVREDTTPQDVTFYDLGDGAITLWSSDACPEPMIVNEFCFSPDAGKLYVGMGAMRMPISTESLVEYWEQYHR